MSLNLHERHANETFERETRQLAHSANQLLTIYVPWWPRQFGVFIASILFTRFFGCRLSYIFRQQKLRETRIKHMFTVRFERVWQMVFSVNTLRLQKLTTEEFIFNPTVPVLNKLSKHHYLYIFLIFNASQ